MDTVYDTVCSTAFDYGPDSFVQRERFNGSPHASQSNGRTSCSTVILSTSANRPMKTCERSGLLSAGS